jgi:hypothetical protein
MNFLAWFSAGMNVSRPECKPLLVLNFYDVPSIFDGHFDTFQAKPSWRFSESRRRIENCVCGSPRKFDFIAGFLETCC